jgi:hypothetical protein
MGKDTTVKNIIRGIGSTFVVCPPRRAYSIGISDAEALRQDWFNVGKDLSTAINKVKHEQRKK